MPVYKVANVIERSLHSIMQQTYSPLECIIVNDGTPDNSMCIINNILEQYTGDIDFKIIEFHVNKGISQARNAGLNNASGDYVFYLDSDDEITPNCINELVQKAKQYPEAEVIQGSYKTYPEEETEYYELQYRNHPLYIDDNYKINDFFLTQKRLSVTVWNKLIKRKVILENNISFIEGIIYEDLPWIFQLVEHVHLIVFNDSITYKYYRQATSITKSSPYSRGLESYAIIIRHCYDNMLPQLLTLQKPFVFQLLLARIYEIYRLYPKPDIIKKYTSLCKYMYIDSIKKRRAKDSVKLLIYMIILQLIRSSFFRNISKKIIGIIKGGKMVKLYR